MAFARRNDRRAEMRTRGFQREAVRDLKRRREVAGAENRLHRIRRLAEGAEARAERCARGRQRQQAQRGLGHDAEQPLAAGEHADEIEAGLVLVRAPAGAQHAAIGEHDLETEHVVARHAVFQTARAARVRRDVSADAAILQARGVRRVVEPLRAHRRLELAGDDARLDHGDSIGEVDLLYPIHPREREHDAAARRHAAADVAVARAARRHGQAAAVREFHQPAHLLCRAGEDHDLRLAARKPLVARMRCEHRGIGGDGIRA